MSITIEENQSSSIGIENAQNAPHSASNRFTKEEKAVLFQLFIDNEEIIDIKQRKTCPKKHVSVRDCWNKIADDFNSHPDTVTYRSVKQIQKFWLNARLRKSYPSGEGSGNESTSRRSVDGSNTSLNNLKTIVVQSSNATNSNAVNPPKLIRIKPEIRPTYETIKFEKECEEIEMVAEEEEEELQHEVEISTSSNDVNMETQQYSIDHISAEKLTLNDLLEFKNGRTGRDDFVLQIRSSGDPLNTSSPNVTHHVKDSSSNTETYTTTSYRIAHPITQGTIPIIQEHQLQQQQQQQQHQPQQIHTTQPQIQQHKIITSPNSVINSSNFFANNTIRAPAIDSVDDKINFYRLKEAEIKYKEEQLKLEQRKIELQKSKEELKNVKELHAYRIREMELKIKLLVEEEKKIKPVIINKKS